MLKSYLTLIYNYSNARENYYGTGRLILKEKVLPGRGPKTYNHFHNILRLLDVLSNFPFTTS